MAAGQFWSAVINRSRPASQGAPHETVSGKSRNWTLFNLAKFTHPGVQVLPGEAISKWHSVMEQWVDHGRRPAAGRVPARAVGGHGGCRRRWEG